MHESHSEIPLTDRPERRILTLEDLIVSVRELVNYSWSDEQADYVQAEEEGNSREGHVFEHIYALNDWLGKHS